jgi:UDP:flavonoid glycosyltransferase YjiC (YdhE family)
VRIIVVASGSRGDVQPLVALARGLASAGHEVTVAATSDFRVLVEGAGLGFHGFSIAVADLIDSDLGRSWLGHSSHRPWVELRLLRQMVDTWGVAIAHEVAALAGQADLFVSGVLTADGVDAVVRAGGGRHVIALLAPVGPSREGAAGLHALLPRSANVLNRWQGEAVGWFMAGAFGSAGAEVRRQLGVAPVSRREFSRIYRETPTVVGVSPQVLPQPRDWPVGHEVTGYWFLDRAPGWQPSAALSAFLGGGPAPVYVGFGSMSTHDSAGTLDAMVAALCRSGLRGVVHSGGARLASSDLPDGVLLVNDVPHDWLFPRCAAVIHHGGAGTTAAGLRAGVPSGVVAHIGDQPLWGRRVWELGVGAKPMRRHQLSVDRLASMMRELTSPSAPQLRSRAAELGARIRSEDGVAVAVETVIGP